MRSTSSAGTARELLRQTFGYPTFRPGQGEVVDHVVAGGDALVLMPTGGGKSLCYQIPSLVRAGTGIVVSPLIALMHDQVAALLQLGVRAAFLNSTQDAATARATERALVARELDLLYVSPERVTMPRCLELIDRAEVALFAIDEAHCVSQWGHDFRPEYLALSVLHQRYPHVPRIALTATADPQTRGEIVTRLDLGSARVFVSSFDRPNIRYTIVDKDDGRAQLLRFIGDEHAGEAGIVYCLSRRKVDETAAWLGSKGVNALPYHAGMDNAARSENQARFQREEGLVMVATIAFGMGIDKPDVRFVAHLDLPKSVEAYYQETGRAGRDGAPADAWMAYGLSDVVQQRRLIEASDATDDYKRVSAAKLDALLGLCETAGCRRVRLLDYFGEASAPCGNCDTCLAPPETYDATAEAQKALSAIYRTGQRFGALHLIDVLRGKAGERVQRWGHDQLSVFGVGADIDEGAWRNVFRQLVALGLASVDHDAHGALRLNASSRPVLKGERTIALRRAQPRSRARGTRRGAVLDAGLSASDNALLDRLKAWRLAEARAQAVPAFVILHDRTLAEIARQRPDGIAAIAAIAGIGAKKLERYGPALVALVARGA
jgi:ATP-dependent DNA helicase RecQ